MAEQTLPPGGAHIQRLRLPACNLLHKRLPFFYSSAASGTMQILSYLFRIRH
jgi:hypothetical protein